MKNHTICALLAAALVGLAVGDAHADLLSLRAEAHGGFSRGGGVGGDLSDDAFHSGTGILTYGVLVGAEVLFLDGWVEHNQYQDDDGLAGTWTQFMVGFDLEFDLSDRIAGAGFDATGRPLGDLYAPVFAELGAAIGLGLGTGQQVMPPLDNSQITDKGFLAQAHIGVGYRLSRLLSVGVTIPVQAGYLFKSGDGLPANDPDNQYQSVHSAVLLNMRLGIKLR